MWVSTGVAGLALFPVLWRFDILSRPMHAVCMQPWPPPTTRLSFAYAPIVRYAHLYRATYTQTHTHTHTNISGVKQKAAGFMDMQ